MANIGAGADEWGNIKEQFRGKKITLMGLGLLGRGLGDARFFAEAGADLIITDLKNKTELAPSIKKFAAFPSIVYHLGAHRLEDFENRDLIIRANNAPLDSPFLARARERGIPIEMDGSLFAKLCAEKFPDDPTRLDAPAVTIVGVTGTRGKSTTTHLVYEMARGAGKKVFLGGNERDTATLPLIETVRTGDLVILELDSWQLQGFAESKISPGISVWTNFLPDHMNYYHGDMERYFEDKAAIARFQRAGDCFIAPQDIKEKVEARFGKLVGAWIDPFVAPNSLPADWEISLPGEHNRANAACAIAAARTLGIPDEVIKKTLKSFTSLPNRLESLGEKNGIAFYNDSNATTPDATIAALRALAGDPKTAGRPIVLIAGGSDKELDFTALAEESGQAYIKKILKKLILFKGVASEKLKTLFPEDLHALVEPLASNMDEAMRDALAAAAPGDIILLSPGATSFGIFKNEYDRGEQFRAVVEKLH